jgi:uncharacterized protein (DUF305 family)
VERDPATLRRADDDLGGPANDDDDVVVLSWWQHPVNVVALVVAAALVAGMIGWLIRDTSAQPDAGGVDIGFLHDMRVHHEQAVAMSMMYLDRPDTDPGLRTVARSILFGQAIDIGRMIQLLRDADAPEAAEGDEAMAWMGMPTTHEQMPGMATDEQIDDLAALEGAAADELFVDLMVDHHDGGVHMAAYAAEHAESGEVRRMAESMARSQQEEIAELEGLVG